jgi:ankyrin repeat protein
MFAIYHKNESIIEFLLRNGAETFYRDHKGRTILHYAIKYKCSKAIMKLLIDYNGILDKDKCHIKDNNMPNSFYDSFQ